MSKKLGIIGGFGAHAGVRMAQQLVELAQARGAARDEDFPDFMLLNVPARGMSEKGLEDAESVRQALRSAVKTLARNECRYIVMACNTAHAFYEELDALTHAEVLDMIHIACQEVKECKAVGILSSETTKDLRLYESTLKYMSIKPIVMTTIEQQLVNGLISKAIAGTTGEVDEGQLCVLIDSLRSRGAERVILACTELPLVLKTVSPAPPVVDAGLATITKALSLL